MQQWGRVERQDCGDHSNSPVSGCQAITQSVQVAEVTLTSSTTGRTVNRTARHVPTLHTHRSRRATPFIKVYFLHQTLGMFPECVLGRQDLACKYVWEYVVTSMCG